METQLLKPGFRRPFLVLSAWVLWLASPSMPAAELADSSLALSAALSVDSTYAGYRTEVLVDGRWYAKGEEPRDSSSADRLGNGGNTWVSGNADAEHWICLEWPQPVAINEVDIWWSLAEFYPSAFRIELGDGGRWVPANGEEGWFVPTDRHSVLGLPRVVTNRLRIFQPVAGLGPRRLMGVQELRVFDRAGEPRTDSGVRRVSPRTLARMAPRPLLRNIAQLHEETPGASVPIHWQAGGESGELPSLVDGQRDTAAVALEAGHAVGIRWPVRHSIDAVTLHTAAEAADGSGLTVEVDDGIAWVRLAALTQSTCSPSGCGLTWTIEPTVTRAVRVRRTDDSPLALPVTELEVLRFLPDSKDVWPARLTELGGLGRQILDAAGEPSFEALALCAHGMASTRYPIGVKDHPNETGVGWDGTLIDHETIRFRWSPAAATLGEFRDTLRRTLIDGWRPGVVVEARLDDLHVRETAFAARAGTRSRPMAFIRLSLRNVSQRPRETSIEAMLSSERPGVLSFHNGLVARGEDAVLLSLSPAVPDESLGALKSSFVLQPGEERHVDFIHPQEHRTTVSELESCRGESYDAAYERFCADWDRILRSETHLELPEPRVDLAIRAVLAQIFVCGDGDLMYYGAAPSVYDRSLFGYEESFPMLGLALFGYGQDAQRYMSATYLTASFLRKVEHYTLAEVESRHQQYRNGLQPHYAVSLYRLTRDQAWLGRHLPLLKQCAEWTITQRRRTMELENGQQPLHWGLLPKWAYGGDVVDVLGYPLFANLCCWRGLMDTAWVLEELGDAETARRYRDEARAYRADIDRAIEGSYLRNHRPPFLPLRVGGTKPDEMLDFYQLFTGCIFDVEPFAAKSTPAGWIMDYVEGSNRMFCHLPRYRPMGPGALDAIYGKGYVLQLLHEDSVRDFLLGLYAYLAFNMEHDTFVSRESNVLYPSDFHQRSAYPAAEVTDPLTCASAVSLHLVRHMLVTEERGEAGGYTENLLLLAGTPRAWLRNGHRIRLDKVPTHFGPISLEVQSAANEGRIEARVTPPTRGACALIKLRLRHPEGRTMQSVQVNGQDWSDFDARGEWIRLPGDLGPSRIAAHYGSQ